jgi:hypothetical protein
MIISYSRNDVPVRITQERWKHITHRHPEMIDQKDKVVDTIANPDLILSGDFGEMIAVRFYPETPLTRKYLIAAYKELSAQDGFLLTSYFTNAVRKKRRVLWKR